MPDAADPNTPPGDLKHRTRFTTTHASGHPMGSDYEKSDDEKSDDEKSTPTVLIKPTSLDPSAPEKGNQGQEQHAPGQGPHRQPHFDLGGGKKRRGKKSRKSRKGKKPRKGKKSRKNKRTKRR